METKTYFRFGDTLCATFPAEADTEILCALWNGFASRSCTLLACVGEDCRIAIGNASFLPPSEGEEYTVCIREEGIGLMGRDLPTLMRAYSALLMQIETEENARFRIRTQDIRGRFSVARRMVHLCVFPETPLSMLRRLVRLCGILSYTHVILEFWGMLRYDCLDALAWENAFEKAEIRPILRDARALGMEPIPMINHLGHASACRIDCGKHVVLDRDPTLQPLFTPDGWCWDITSARVGALLRQMRAELYELFGEGAYFHVGCDEAHFYSSDHLPLSRLESYLRDLTGEVIAEGRRPILWGDMIVAYNTNSDKPAARREAERQNARMAPLLTALHPQSVIADWHYDIKTAPIPSVLRFQRAGFDVIGCPWDNADNIAAHHATAVEHGTYGMMMTTWHTLHEGMSYLLTCARQCGLPKCDWSDAAGHRNLEIATLLRRVHLEKDPLPYAECGFTERQTAPTIHW